MSNRSRLRLLVIVLFTFANVSFFFRRQNVTLQLIGIETSSTHKNVVTSASCFLPRKNAVSGHLPGPFINVGMPKMGSTSLHKVKLSEHHYLLITCSLPILWSYEQYFCCGNYTSSHWECGKGKGLCADCMKKAVASGSHPLKSCGNFQSFMQMDKDSFFPQIELPKKIHEESPNATFILMFRDMSAWYRRWVNNGFIVDARWYSIDKISIISIVCRTGKQDQHTQSTKTKESHWQKEWWTQI